MAKPPRTRAECENGPRPCPWARCRYHLGVEVRLFRPGNNATAYATVREVPNWDDGRPTCCLDVVADEREYSQGETAKLLSISQQYVDRVEKRLLRRPEWRGYREWWRDAGAVEARRASFHPDAYADYEWSR